MAGRYLAYAFRSPLRFSEMLEELNRTTPWTWVMGDSETFGDYLVTRPYKRFSKFRIVEETGGYLFDIFYDFDDPEAADLWETQHELILQELLPALKARDIKPADNLG